MNCVFWAWWTHARALGIAPPARAIHLFEVLYLLSGSRGGMHGACIPFTIRVLNRAAGLEIAQMWHHPFWGQAAHVASAENWMQRLMARWGDFGQVGDIPAPAIYLWIGGHHAFFGRCPPVGWHIMLAIQLRTKQGRVAQAVEQRS